MRPRDAHHALADYSIEAGIRPRNPVVQLVHAAIAPASKRSPATVSRRNHNRRGWPRMRVRALFSIVLVAAACDRDANITGVQNDHPSSVVSSVAGADFLVAPTAIAPAGLAACWPGEGNALDIANGNSGTVLGAVSFAAGKFGQAFSFDALGGDVRIPAGAAEGVEAE